MRERLHAWFMYYEISFSLHAYFIIWRLCRFSRRLLKPVGSHLHKKSIAFITFPFSPILIIFFFLLNFISFYLFIYFLYICIHLNVCSNSFSRKYIHLFKTIWIYICIYIFVSLILIDKMYIKFFWNTFFIIEITSTYYILCIYNYEYIIIMSGPVS